MYVRINGIKQYYVCKVFDRIAYINVTHYKDFSRTEKKFGYFKTSYNKKIVRICFMFYPMEHTENQNSRYSTNNICIK